MQKFEKNSHKGIKYVRCIQNFIFMKMRGNFLIFRKVTIGKGVKYRIFFKILGEVIFKNYAKTSTYQNKNMSVFERVKICLSKVLAKTLLT